LIIAEKPDAAKRIATALDKNANPQKLNRSGVPYFEAYRNGKILIVPAIGHLYTILSEDKGHNGFRDGKQKKERLKYAHGSE
jgi:DNA topoisomerase IA